MSAHVTPTGATVPRARRAITGTVLLFTVVLGVPAYFIAFLFAYGFREDVDVPEHATFLVLVASFAVACGLLGAAVAPTAPRARVAARATFGVLVSLAVNSLVVGVGSVVSAAHKDEGSVSADFSTTTDALVASGLVLCAVLLATAASRVDLGGGPGRDHR